MVFDDIKVGDQFRDKQRLITLTVTELTERGFKYTNDPFYVFPARWGMGPSTAGECFYKQHREINWDFHYVKVNNHEQGNWKNWPGSSETWVQETQQTLGSTSTQP